MLFWLAHINATVCAGNVALYLAVDSHPWWSGSTAVLSGLVALIIAIQDTGNRR